MKPADLADAETGGRAGHARKVRSLVTVHNNKVFA